MGRRTISTHRNPNVTLPIGLFPSYLGIVSILLSASPYPISAARQFEPLTSLPSGLGPQRTPPASSASLDHAAASPSLRWYPTRPLSACSAVPALPAPSLRAPAGSTSRIVAA